MRDVASYANSPFLWACALGVFAVIVLQSLIYMRAAADAGPDLDFSREDLRRSLRAGGVAAIGPSLAVVIVAIALLTLLGTPAVLVRIGLVGSAATETSSATLVATTMGAQLGGPTWTPEVFTAAFFAMGASGGMWMVSALVLTPILKRGDAHLRHANPALMAIVPSAALLGAFASLGVAELPKSNVHVVTVVASAAVMAVCLWLARRLDAAWLREWGLGIAILLALGLAYVAHHHTGLGPA
ncbi:DUF5058 family protein [Agilicoccus flavus]|uniref:DUF5058 family protein n=1 Tax=Agilicoccus flavus TaxID=2775968 RepID=UPI001CF709CF|nr:DUF5058 family protein [Agilicoccus flavus]